MPKIPTAPQPVKVDPLLAYAVALADLAEATGLTVKDVIELGKAKAAGFPDLPHSIASLGHQIHRDRMDAFLWRNNLHEQRSDYVRE